jgi:hypothetical protein
MFSFGWFSSGRDQAALDLFNAVLDRIETGFILGRLAYVFCDRKKGETRASDHFLAAVRPVEHAAAYKLGGRGRKGYPDKRVLERIIERLR